MGFLKTVGNVFYAVTHPAKAFIKASQDLGTVLGTSISNTINFGVSLNGGLKKDFFSDPVGVTQDYLSKNKTVVIIVGVVVVGALLIKKFLSNGKRKFLA
jgi:hypothetical protein